MPDDGKTPGPAGPPEIAERLAVLRAIMKARGADAILLQATDEWLNEYVPVDRSDRVAFTGFSGSMGDALITADRALLIVDGRYTLQAKEQSPAFEVQTIPLGSSIEEGWLALLSELAEAGAATLAVPTTCMTVSLFGRVTRACAEAGLRLDVGGQALVDEAREELGLTLGPPAGKAFGVPTSLTGRSVRERVQETSAALAAAEVDAYLSVPLDEIAWLTDLRGDAFPFQATFPARALVFRGVRGPGKVGLTLPGVKLKKGTELEEGIETGPSLAALVKAALDERDDDATLTVGFDPATTPEALRAELLAAGRQVAGRPAAEPGGGRERVTLVEMDSPLRPLRTHKTPEELAHMVSAFARADEVVKKLQSWVSGQVSKGEKVTEADVSAKLTRLYKRSGAFGHSFRTIAGAGPHGAIIHYGTPDETTPLEEGALFLLDSGAFYEGGLATDLTRTFIVGKAHVKPTEEQRRLFTLVLKAAIAGMSARVPVGVTGEQLDAIVRHPLWQAGLDYGHGTGHGVGVNVHEFPPRVAPRVRATLEPGYVFSIEPGVYLEGQLGIRVENLCTIEPDPDDQRFLRVRPLTFSPLDKRLIDKGLLSKQERAFLDWFAARHKAQDALSAPLPPCV